MSQEPNTRYIVRETVAEAPGVSTLQLSLSNGSVPKYIPGQFITVYAPELGTPEGKAYSISSAPHEKTLNITVKDMGKFSHYLCSRKPGDEVEGSLPYGYFFSESRTSMLALICGGIGIAPMRSMLIEAARETPRRSVALFYSNRTAQDIIFKKTLDELGEDNKNIKRVLDWLSIKTQLNQNRNLDASYENNVKSLGSKNWNIPSSAKIYTNTGKAVVFKGSYQTWLITARDGAGNKLFNYYYILDTTKKIEVWVFDDQATAGSKKLRNIFYRDYNNNQYPSVSKGTTTAGLTLKSAALNV